MRRIMNVCCLRIADYLYVTSNLHMYPVPTGCLLPQQTGRPEAQMSWSGGKILPYAQVSANNVSQLRGVACRCKLPLIMNRRRRLLMCAVTVYHEIMLDSHGVNWLILTSLLSISSKVVV